MERWKEDFKIIYMEMTAHNASDCLSTSQMFDDQNMLIPYQLSGDCLSGLSNDAGASTSDNANKEAADKRLLQYNPPLDFSELLDDDSSLVPEREYLCECLGGVVVLLSRLWLIPTSIHFLAATNVDENGSLNTPQPQ